MLLLPRPGLADHESSDEQAGTEAVVERED